MFRTFGRIVEFILYYILCLCFVSVKKYCVSFLKWSRIQEKGVYTIKLFSSFMERHKAFVLIPYMSLYSRGRKKWRGWSKSFSFASKKCDKMSKMKSKDISYQSFLFSTSWLFNNNNSIVKTLKNKRLGYDEHLTVWRS